MLSLLLVLSFAYAGTPVQADILSSFHEYQGDTPLCAVLTEKDILTAYTGQVYPLNEFLQWFLYSGNFDVAKGVPIDRLGSALDVKGYTLETLTAPTIDRIGGLLGRGFAVVAVVNPDRCWNPNDPMNDFAVDLLRRYELSPGTHVVWVTWIDQKYVWVNDTAIPNAPVQIHISDFLTAIKEGGSKVLYVPRILPPLDPDKDGTIIADNDLDGYYSIHTGGRDCDDGNPDVHPLATDIPNDNVDQDCSGYDFVDIDQDGHASLQVGGDDCDDGNDQVHPGSPERCNNIDDNCNDEVDEGDICLDRMLNSIDEYLSTVKRTQSVSVRQAWCTYRREDLSTISGAKDIWYVASDKYKDRDKEAVEGHCDEVNGYLCSMYLKNMGSKHFQVAGLKCNCGRVFLNEKRMMKHYIHKARRNGFPRGD